VADLTERPYRPGDAVAIAGLYNTIERAVGGYPGYLAEETGALIETLVHDPERNSRLLFDSGGALVASGMVPTPPEGGFRVDLVGGVHPDWRGQGIGRELLGWQLARAAEIHRATAPDAEWQAETAATVGDDDADRLYKRMGLAPVRYFFEMLAPTRQAPPPVLPAGLRSVGYRPELEYALYEAHMEAFTDHWGYQRRSYEAWAPITVRSSTFRADLSRIVCDGDEIAAYLLSYEDASPERVYIGQVGTRRPWRRRGLAGALLTEALTAAAATGKDFASLGVDADSATGAVGVYERAGFEVEFRAAAYRRPIPG
jgi:ribosomal protein S18 acetylase RimI-like enzyme